MSDLTDQDIRDMTEPELDILSAAIEDEINRRINIRAKESKHHELCNDK